MEKSSLSYKKALTHCSESELQSAIKNLAVTMFVLSVLVVSVGVALVEYGLSELRAATSAITPHPDLNMRTLETQLQSINDFIQEHKQREEKNSLDAERLLKAIREKDAGVK